jgi:hypothetical protein
LRPGEKNKRKYALLQEQCVRIEYKCPSASKIAKNSKIAEEGEKKLYTEFLEESVRLLQRQPVLCATLIVDSDFQKYMRTLDGVKKRKQHRITFASSKLFTRCWGHQVLAMQRR